MSLYRRKITTKVQHFLKNVYLWDTTVSLYMVLAILWKKIITFDIDQRAAAVSFSFMLAVFPGILFLFTLIPYVPIKNLDIQIMTMMKDILPNGIYATAYSTIKDIVSNKRIDILSFGFLFTVYAATNGMTALMRAFNMALHEPEKRTFFQARFIGLFLTFLLVLVLISAIVVVIVANLVIDFFSSKNMITEDTIYYLFQLLRYSSIFLIFFFGISVIYYFGPAVEKKLRFFNIGAVIASLLCIVATHLFSYYLSNFASYNRLYGSIGTLIGLMVWLYLISLILILGFEINSSLRDALRIENGDS